ncbi:MAG TPA: hypothetical protein VGG08_08800 [Solirubrobacteraceae bacterium]|jgi:hypothetical protein
MSRRLLCAAVLCASLVVPALAGAHGATPWFGTYGVSVVGGSQDASWTLQHTPISPCDAPASGQGSDDQTFTPGASKTLELSGVGTSAFPTTIDGLELQYSENRDGTITQGQPADANPADCDLISGEGVITPQPDCGPRSLSTEIDVDPAPGAASIEQSPAAGAGQEPPYKDCPVFGDVVPAFAAPLVAVLPPLGPASAGGLAAGEAKLTAVEPETETGVSGQSTLNVELRFTRLAVFDALGMPADANLAVSASGAVTVPVGCPAGAACGGSVSLDLGAGASGASARAASSAPRFPTPVGTYAVALVSAKFHLRPHQKGVVLHLHGGRLFAKSLARETLDVVVSEGSGKKSVRYVAGTAHLRP